MTTVDRCRSGLRAGLRREAGDLETRGGPLDAVTAGRLTHARRAAERHARPRSETSACRLEVLGILPGVIRSKSFRYVRGQTHDERRDFMARKGLWYGCRVGGAPARSAPSDHGQAGLRHNRDTLSDLGRTQAPARRISGGAKVQFNAIYTGSWRASRKLPPKYAQV
jgi:hypothetical protein